MESAGSHMGILCDDVAHSDGNCRARAAVPASCSASDLTSFKTVAAHPVDAAVPGGAHAIVSDVTLLSPGPLCTQRTARPHTQVDPLRSFTRRARRLWLCGLLLAMLFSALQSVLGAVVVGALTGGAPLVEVCTPQGMRWMPLAAAELATPSSGPGATGTASDLPASLRGLAQPCAWALAHVSVPPAPPTDRQPVLPMPVRLALPPPDTADRLPPVDSGRILLTAPMRAPPARTA